MHVKRLIVAAMICGGCADNAAKQAPAATPSTDSSAPSSLSERGAPMTLTVKGPETASAGESFTIKIHISRLSASPEPIRLVVRLPADVTLIDGRAVEELVDATATSFERTLRFRATSPVAGDVWVNASSGGVDHGAVANVAYRFGRPEPKLPPVDLPTIGLTGGRR